MVRLLPLVAAVLNPMSPPSCVVPPTVRSRFALENLLYSAMQQACQRVLKRSRGTLPPGRMSEGLPGGFPPPVAGGVENITKSWRSLTDGLTDEVTRPALEVPAKRHLRQEVLRFRSFLFPRLRESIGTGMVFRIGVAAGLPM